MASHDYNRHPLPAPPSHEQEQQYQYSYNQAASHQQVPPAQQYHSRQQQQQQQHPPPPPPPPPPAPTQNQSQQRPTGRDRPRSRGFSFRSDKSQKTDKSGQGGGHIRRISGGGLHETHAEKEAKRLNTKADPTLAMQEAEPSAVARTAVNWEEKPPLSSIQHKDATGVVIADPDRSNPTRSKWERPLDTIRSFEAALDSGHSSRQSVYRADTESVANWNRRSSYYGNSSGPRFPHESYYGSRSTSNFQNFQRESAMFDPRGSAMMGGPRDGYFDGADYGNNGQRNRYSRMQTDPYMNGRPAVNRSLYPNANNHKSYETVASGSGSASYGEPSGYQTDPTSSENSSINRRASPPKRHQEPKNDYGISFGQTPEYQPTAPAASQPRTMPDSSHVPPPPPKSSGTLLRKGSRAAGVAAAAAAPQRPDVGDKRKSWFSRRFSKNS